MTDPREHEPEGSGDGVAPARLRRELALTFAASVLLTGALALVQAQVALLAPYVYIAVAFVFLALPTMVVQRWRRADAVAAGMRFGPLGRGLAWGLGATAVTLLPFAVGYHLWSVHALERRAEPSWARYWQWDEATLGRPAAVDGAQPGIWVWTEGERVRVWWRDAPEAAGLLEVEVEGSPADAAVVAVAEQGVVSRQVESSGAALRLAAVPGREGLLHGFDLAVAPQGERLMLSFSRGGRALEAGAVRVGGSAQGSTGDPVVLERSLMWLFNLLLIQVFFVGLPEEYFYRGYVQPTLARLTGEHGRGVLAVRAIALTSVLFALGHVLVDFVALRASVFFPSLVFGWLRERSGGLVAPLVYHGMCNAMVELAAVHYVV